MTVWDEILERLRTMIADEDFRRWFGPTAYASDSGDQITVWAPSEPVRRHITNHYDVELRTALAALGREDTHVRFVVSGTDEDEDEDDGA
jgi:chromosomal replication initiation ATPase DnaA